MRAEARGWGRGRVTSRQGGAGERLAWLSTCIRLLSGLRGVGWGPRTLYPSSGCGPCHSQLTHPSSRIQLLTESARHTALKQREGRSGVAEAGRSPSGDTSEGRRLWTLPRLGLCPQPPGDGFGTEGWGKGLSPEGVLVPADLWAAGQ